MIVFTKDISTTDLLLAYVNNVVEFNSDSVSPAVKATITIGTSVKTIYTLTDYPFEYNFKEWITSIMNVDNFKDDLTLDILVDGYVYDWTDKVYFNNDIAFEVFLEDDTTETATKNVKFLSAYLQDNTYKQKYPINSSLNAPVILSPYLKATNNSCYLKHWEGYPFDISIYTGVSDGLTVLNQTNLLDTTFTPVNTINRIALSDGYTTTTIEDVLTLVDGFNVLKFTSNDLDYYATLEKINNTCEGHYIKWINDLGGFNYWFFDNGSVDRNIKDLGELDNDFDNFTDTISRTIQIGKLSNDTLQVTSDVINEDENLLLSGILDSPKIYLFTGQPFAKANFNDWMEVSLDTTRTRITHPKRSLNIINLSFSLPQRNTRKI